MCRPHSGPRLDWDPEVMAVLDDAEMDQLDFDDEANILDDMFVMQAEGYVIIKICLKTF